MLEEKKNKNKNEKTKVVCLRFPRNFLLTHITSNNNNNNNSTMYVLSHFSLLQLCNPMDHSLPGSSVCRFFRQKYWSVSPCPPSGTLPDPGCSILITAGTHGSYVCSIVRWVLYHGCLLGGRDNSIIHKSIRIN